ncbi:hypothetical protein KYK30_25795 [Shinella yambaruensis]|uniref:Uncharacterized protein n=2 Tax=Shinella TaxID=323620 RepID=A0ABQ5ZRW3_9HYPH|nr:hypothetical protein [Shinella yambaruensis]MCJ8027675.1 hypothetical protein [Shinella yambaruensis]MCU7983125.1 hypothetical protein [Shinella yambaruensis]GLR54642.1 hypothetical protein GCM10007923_58610 [Shinella yambaruensis]
MNCIDCRLIHYAKASSLFNGIHRPFVYVVYSECVARAAFRLDPQLSIFKLGFSGGGQDRFRSLIEGWSFRNGRTPPLGNCRRWESLGVWKMHTAEAFERKFKAVAQARGRIVPPHVYGWDENSSRLAQRTNGETEIYWFNDTDFSSLPLYQDKVCTEERRSFEMLAEMFGAIRARNEAFKAKMSRPDASG